MGTPKDYDSSPALKVIGVIAIVAFIWAVYNNNEREEYSSLKNGASDEHAFYMATEVIKSALKAPATAQFCTYSDARLTKADGNLLITGWVDAQNSFGALIRSDWSVQLIGPPTNYTLGSVIFDGKKLK